VIHYKYFFENPGAIKKIETNINNFYFSNLREDQVMAMVQSAARLIEENLRFPSG
jgi:hypothetical protein